MTKIMRVTVSYVLAVMEKLLLKIGFSVMIAKHGHTKDEHLTLV